MDLVIGPRKAIVSIHQVLLRRYSGYFFAALSKRWAGNRRRTIKLPDEDVAVVKQVCCWIYTKSLVKSGHQWPKAPARFVLPETPKDELSEISMEEYRYLCRIYIFADQKMMPALKNAVIDIFAAYLCLYDSMPTPVLQLVADNTPRDCALMRLLVDYMVMRTNEKILHQTLRKGIDEETISVDIMLTCASVARRARHLHGMSQVSWIKQLRLCDYHDHHDIGENALRAVREAESPSPESERSLISAVYIKNINEIDEDMTD